MRLRSVAPAELPARKEGDQTGRDKWLATAGRLPKTEPPDPVPEVDVSAEGTLVWVRRPNGSWWPGRVISRLDVPEGCPAPPRSPATPILLLGRRDGPNFVDWCNLERSKRVKPFRCGEREFEESIRKAEELDARRRSSSATTRKKKDKRVGNSGRYARKEDAILQAVEIERARLRDAAAAAKARQVGVTRSKVGNGATRSRSSSHAAAAGGRCEASKPSSGAVDLPPSPKRKRRTPNDSEDELPQGSRRMKDLTEIGLKAVPKPLPNAATFPDPLNFDLPSTSQGKRSKPHFHPSANRKGPSVDQDQPCGVPRKRDRSRTLSELCNGETWNGTKSNGGKANEHQMDMRTCSVSSFGAASLLDKPCSRRTSVKTEVTDVSPMTGLLNNSLPHGVHVGGATLTVGNILQADHLQGYQPCAPTKDLVLKHNQQSTDCSRGDMPSQCGLGNNKKITNSVDHEGNNRTRSALEREQRKTRSRASTNEVVYLEPRVHRSSVNKTAGPNDRKGLPTIPNNGLDRVGAVLQQFPESAQGHKGPPKIKVECIEPSVNMNSHSNGQNISKPCPVVEMPLQVLPHHQRAPGLAMLPPVKATKTLQLNSGLYDVEVKVHGHSNKGRHVPLVSLMSRWNKRPVVGYPVTVEILDNVCPRPAPSIHDHRPSTSSVVNVLVKKEEAAVPLRQLARPPASLPQLTRPPAPLPQPPRPSASHKNRAKPKSRRKPSEDETDKSWRPHTKNPVSSPRKMRRLSSFSTSQRGGEDRKSAVGKFSGPAVACIPLRVVFSRINEALNYAVK